MKQLLFRITHLLSHIVLIGFLFSVLLSAVLTVSFSYFLPRADRYRVELLDWLNQQNPETQVSAEKISGRWEAFRPSLQLYNVNVSNAGWASDLTFSKLTVQFDVLKSLKYEKAIFSHVELSDLSFTLAQNTKGEWQLSTGNFNHSEAADIKPIVRSLWGIDNLKIDDLRLRLKPYQQEGVDLPPLEVQGVNENHQRRLLVNLKDGNKKVNVLTASAWGKPFTDAFRAQGYLRLKKLQTFDFSCLLAKSSAIKEAKLDIGLWFEWQDQSLELVTDIDIRDGLLRLNANKPEEKPELFKFDQLQTRAKFIYKDNVAKLWVPAVSLTAKKETLKLKKLYIKKEQALSFYLSAFNLEQLNVIADWKILPEKLDDVLSTLAPQGQLHDISLTLNRDDFRLLASLENVSVGAWKGVPQLTSVTGRLDTRKEYGHIDFKSRDLSTYFPQIYSRQQDFDYAQGRVSWQFDENWLNVAGEDITIDSVYGDAEGAFYVQVPLSQAMKDQEPARLVLDIDLSNGSAAHRADLIPDKKLPAPLLQWLDESIIAASVNKAKFIFHGPLHDIDDQIDEQMVIQLWLDIEKGRLRYVPELPELADLKGEMLLDNTDVFAAVDHAQSTAINLSHGRFSLVDEGSKHKLSVAADMAGTAKTAHDFLTLPLINKASNQLFDTLLFNQGTFKADLKLTSSLTDFEEDLGLTVNAKLNASNLLLPEQDILIDNIFGGLTFSLSEGLKSNGLKGKLFDKPIQATIATNKKQVTQVDFKAKIAMDDINTWRYQPALTFFKGEADVLGKLTFDHASAAIQLTSDLKGVSSSLPFPFAKKAQEKGALALRFPLTGREQVLNIDYGLGSRAYLHLLFEDDQIRAGELNFSEKAKGFIPQVLRVGGALLSVDLTPWVSTFERLEKAMQKDPEASSALAWQVKIDPLHIEELRIEDCQLSDVTLFGESYPGFWHINFEQSFIEGGLDFYNDKSKPLSVFIKTVNLDELLKMKGADQSEKPIDTSKFFAMDVVIDRLIFKQKDLGFWQFKAYVDKPENTLVYTDIVARKDHQEIGFWGQGSPTELRWNPEKNLTKIKGRMSGNNFSEVLTMLGFGKEITSKAFNLQGWAEWKGSPGDFSFKTAKGSLAFNFKDGSFTDIDTSSSQAIKVIGIFNISYILKRLQLDFSDLTKKGFAFDQLKGSVDFDQGIVETKDTVSVKSPSSNISINGSTNLNDESLNLDMSVSLPLASNIPWIATLAATGAIGLWPAAGVFLVSHLFKNQVNKLSTFVYHIKGSLSEPTIRFKKLFDTEGKEKKKIKKKKNS